MTEKEVMPAICSGWMLRASALGLKKGGAKYLTDMEAYMQGALAALVAAGLMTPERAGMFAFLTSVGRLPKLVEDRAKEYKE